MYLGQLAQAASSAMFCSALFASPIAIGVWAGLRSSAHYYTPDSYRDRAHSLDIYN